MLRHHLFVLHLHLAVVWIDVGKLLLFSTIRPLPGHEGVALFVQVERQGTERQNQAQLIPRGIFQVRLVTQGILLVHPVAHHETVGLQYGAGLKQHQRTEVEVVAQAAELIVNQFHLLQGVLLLLLGTPIVGIQHRRSTIAQHILQASQFDVIQLIVTLLQLQQQELGTRSLQLLGQLMQLLVRGERSL